MNIITWTGFAKRRNSTLQPAAADGTTVTAKLKENTSTQNPVFILQGGVSAVNYVRAFARYYFVDDVVSIDNHMHELHCSIDVLATYRSTIRSYTAFVERAASRYDTMVNDPYLSSRQEIISMERMNNESAWFDDDGCYVVQCFAKNGGIVIYATPDLSIYGNVLDTSTYSATDITNWIDRKVAQAFDLDVYIGSVKWLPIDITKIGTATNSLYVGPVDIHVNPNDGYVIRKSDQRTPIGIEIVPNLKFATSNRFGDFRDYSPKFSKYRLSMPGVGFVELDPMIMGEVVNNPFDTQFIVGSKYIRDWMFIDYISGDIVHQLMLAEYLGGQGTGSVKETPFASYRGNIGVSMPLTKSSSDTLKGVTNIGTGVAAGASAGGVPGAIIGGALGLVGAVGNEFAPDTSFINGVGYDNMKLLQHQTMGFETLAIKYGAKEYPTSVAGRPLYQNVQLSTLSGFVKCGNASVPISGYDQDKEAVNSYLNSGFYME